MNGLEEVRRQIIDRASEAIVFTDHEGVIRLWNEGAEAIFGHRPEEVIGRSLDVIIPEKLRARHWDGYRRVVGGAPSRYGAGELLAVPALRKDGERISIEFSIVSVIDEQGGIKGVAAIIRDVTERWRRENEAKRAARSSSG